MCRSDRDGLRRLVLFVCPPPPEIAIPPGFEVRSSHLPSLEMVSTCSKSQLIGRSGKQFREPDRRSFTLDEGERAAVDQTRIGPIGRVDRNKRCNEVRAQVAHSDSPTSATNGAASS